MKKIQKYKKTEQSRGWAETLRLALVLRSSNPSTVISIANELFATESVTSLRLKVRTCVRVTSGGCIIKVHLIFLHVKHYSVMVRRLWLRCRASILFPTIAGSIPLVCMSKCASGNWTPKLLLMWLAPCMAATAISLWMYTKSCKTLWTRSVC